MKNFETKLELFMFIKSSISQDIILTGSTALVLHGLCNKSDPNDLDIIICNPTDNTNKQLELLKLVWPVPEKAVDTAAKPDGKSTNAAPVTEDEYTDEVN